MEKSMKLNVFLLLKPSLKVYGELSCKLLTYYARGRQSMPDTFPARTATGQMVDLTEHVLDLAGAAGR